MPTQEEIAKISKMLSSERFEACRLAGEPDEQALARSKWNTGLAEALYPCLQALEVGFRNRLHQAIGEVCKDPNWILSRGFLKESEMKMIEYAKSDLEVRKKPITTGYLIAELKFGFWTSLADSRYDKMWPKIIKPMFPAMPNTIRNRPEISKRLNSVRHLRNAVSHHHSIWHWADLPMRYENIYTLLDWMEPPYAVSVKAHDRFLIVLQNGHGQFL